MKDYQPLSRRPIADLFRNTAAMAVRLCIRWGIHPDAVSYLSIIASILTALCFWQASVYPWLLILGPGFAYLRLWFNMLDGMVALASGKASLRGEIINELPDRISDILIFAGVAHSQLCSADGAYLGALFAVLTAYVGVLGQAVGAKREFSGLMSKPWRMVALHIGSWLTLGFLWCGNGQIRWGGLTILDWTNLIIILGCLQTIWLRLARILQFLQTKPGSKS